MKSSISYYSFLEIDISVAAVYIYRLYMYPLKISRKSFRRVSKEQNITTHVMVIIH